MNKKWTKEFEKEWQKQYRLNHKSKIKDYNKKYLLENKEKNRESNRKERENLKIDILSHYSGNKICCAYCGFDDNRALQLDHINNNGAEERIKLFGNRTYAGTTFYRWVRRQNYPEGYQVLCANCNIIKLREFDKT